ncbi:MAG: hypothetical protein IT355_15335 [Gemmatimonadaceae bacterium]|nr:hypothetical protein [Gemmatimonadaceae bacterium]
MQRVIVLGNAGSGKSTLATKLAQIVGVPVVHLDAFFWQPGWQPSPRLEWAERVRALAEQDAWIMDGNYAATLPLRLARTDHVILLDVPRVQCIYRVVRRGMRTRGQSRPDLAAGCREQWPEPSFIRWIWRFPVDELPPMLRHLAEFAAPHFAVTRLSASQVAPFLAQVAAGTGSSATLAAREAT